MRPIITLISQKTRKLCRSRSFYLGNSEDFTEPYEDFSTLLAPSLCRWMGDFKMKIFKHFNDQIMSLT